MGFPIRRSSDQSVFAAPRRLSQRITSFIACACQGIHQLPLRHLIILIANTHQVLVAAKRTLPECATQPAPCSPQPNDISRKDQLLEICPMAAVKLTNHGQGIERPLRRTTFINTQPLHESTYGALSSMTELRWRNPNKSSLHNVIQNRRIASERAANLFFFLVTWPTSTRFNTLFRRPPGRRRSFGALAENGGEAALVGEQKEWWSRTGSNRRHPACKAGALPAELRPQLKWWAWEDLNLRPHAYQARALTN